MNDHLWDSVQAFDFDKPLSDYGFSTRLAKENYWTRDFTSRAIMEYRKFMYLAATSDMMVSPSGVVDVVWHEHLVFTQSYSDFAAVLGKTIQHIPSTHSRVEFDKFRQAKERTRKLYLAKFGEMPKDVWESDSMYDCLELPKAGIKIRTFILIGLLAFAGLGYPLYQLLKPLYVNIDSFDFLFGFLALVFFLFITLRILNRFYLRKLIKRLKPYAFIFKLNPIEVVYLESRNQERVVQDALHRLVRDGKIQINNKRFEPVEGVVPTTPEEYAVIDVVTAKKNGGYDEVRLWLERKPIFLNVSNCMDALQKYIIKSKAFGLLFYVNFALMGLVFMCGAVRFITGVLRDRPVTIIAVILAVLFLIVVHRLFTLGELMTRKIIPDLYRERLAPAGHISAHQDWMFFLVGVGALAPTFSPLVRQSTGSGADTWSSSSSSDSGSSSDSSSCGSSCSSCGGCGGGGGD